MNCQKLKKLSVLKTNHDINKIWCEFYGVVNLSNYSCNQNELSVLEKGSKFCPTPPPKYCHGVMKESIDKFFRSASLKLFFGNNSNPDPEDILENSFLSEEDTDTAF